MGAHYCAGTLHLLDVEHISATVGNKPQTPLRGPS